MYHTAFVTSSTVDINIDIQLNIICIKYNTSFFSSIKICITMLMLLHSFNSVFSAKITASMSQGVAMASPQQVMVQVPATASSPCCTSTQPEYAATTSKALGILQMIGGVMAIVCQCVLLGVSSAGGYSGAGIWCGIMVGNWKLTKVKPAHVTNCIQRPTL